MATLIKDKFAAWEDECSERLRKLTSNEKKLNELFHDTYNVPIHGEVFSDALSSVSQAELQREIRSLISYAVGCMFGRYSLDVEGLAYAGGEWDAGKYTTYPADKDNIIPICDDEYFDDDIVSRFVKFIAAVYGKDTLEENLKFIADALGGKGQPREVIRNYFLNDFYADHCKTYQKRPIYWLFDSGKKNGFKALIYMHRYQPDTIARIRTDYVHEQQSRYQDHVLYLDGGRHLIPFPKSNTVYRNNLTSQEPSLTYLYFNMDSIAGKLFNCFACVRNNWYNEKWDVRPGVAFLTFQDKAEQQQFEAFVWGELQAIEAEYTDALTQRQYIRIHSTEDYFIGGWSKANEIKSWHLYEQFMGLTGSSLIEKLPEMPN